MTYLLRILALTMPSPIRFVHEAGIPTAVGPALVLRMVIVVGPIEVLPLIVPSLVQAQAFRASWTRLPWQTSSTVAWIDIWNLFGLPFRP